MPDKPEPIPFGRIPRAVVTSGGLIGLPPAALAVFIVLAAHAAPDWKAYPGTDRLAALAGIRTRSAERALKMLQQRGLIRRADGGVGRGHACVWEIVTEPAATINPDGTVGVSAPAKADTGVGVSEEKPTGRDTKPRPGATRNPDRARHETPTGRDRNPDRAVGPTEQRTDREQNSEQSADAGSVSGLGADAAGPDGPATAHAERTPPAAERFRRNGHDHRGGTQRLGQFLPDSLKTATTEPATAAPTPAVDVAAAAAVERLVESVRPDDVGLYRASPLNGKAVLALSAVGIADGGFRAAIVGALGKDFAGYPGLVSAVAELAGKKPGTVRNPGGWLRKKLREKGIRL